MLGRKQIFTTEKEITPKNVVKVLRDALLIHTENAMRFEYLYRYEEGYQPLVREKTYRTDIDVETSCGLANQITEFKTGFHYGNPITFIQAKDSGKEEAVTMLNDMYDIDNSFSKQQKLGRDSEIGGYGISYYEHNKEYAEGEALWKEIPLDPRSSFIVYSSYYADNRKMMGVSYSQDDAGNTYYTCITKDTRYYIKNSHKIENGKEIKDAWGIQNQRSGEINELGVIPFVEWLRSYDRMGCFERQIPMMDALNIMESDFINDVDQNTQCVWFGVDIDFEKDRDGVEKLPQSGDWILASSSDNGKPSVQPMSVPYDYNGILNNISTTKAKILESAYVPCRNDNSGGSTGVAMSDATGWSGAEMIASKQQALIEQAKMEELKIILAIIKTSANTPKDSPLRTLKLNDVKPNIKRQKTYELSIKVNSLATMIQNGIYGEDAIKTINLFDDPNEVWLHSKDTVEAIQQGMKPKDEPQENRIMSDVSDQINNSPNLDGMRTEK